MKVNKSLIILLGIIAFAIQLAATVDPPVVIGITSPTVKQIKNIETLFEKDLICIKKIKLIGIYHEDEKTDYHPSKQYVKENLLSWVSFISIKGRPAAQDIFNKNEWTPQFKKIFDSCDGIIFTGGEDIPPQIYGSKCNLLTEPLTPIRSTFECSFLFHLLGGKQNPGFVPLMKAADKFVILGICLGAQTLNVATGGTLYQDIPTELYGQYTAEEVLASGQDTIHSSRYMKKLNPLEEDLAPAFHGIKFTEYPPFLEKSPVKMSDNPLVLSSHHQAIRELGENLYTIATSMDGKIPEIIRHVTFENVLGVQFHPEYAALYLKGKFFLERPGSSPDLNLGTFLTNHPPSMAFHIQLWKWFSQALKASRHSQ